MRIILTILFFSMLTCKGQITGFHFNTFQSKPHPKYGVLIANDTFTIQKEINLAKSLGVIYYRHRLIINTWNGVDNSFQRLEDSNMLVVMNLLSSTQVDGGPPRDYSANMIGYADTLRLMLNTYHPDLVVIENEMFNTNYYNVNPAQYITMLQTAAPIVHSYFSPTGVQLKIVDGGLPHAPLYMLVYRWLQAHASQAIADTFGNVCLQPFQINAAKNPCANANLETQMANVQLVLDAAKNGTTDYVNWHDKEPYNPNYDTTLLPGFTQITRYVIRYTKMFVKATTGKELITNEAGQRYNVQPLLVTRELQEFYNQGIPYCIWYSGDSNAAGARSLFDTSGAIRPNGVAFQTFIFGLSHLGIP